jgi:hypothetical protein
MNDLSKSQKKKLRKLAIQAYENELKAELKGLFTKFKEWENNKISSGELSILIHEYDRGPSKNMFSYYNNIDPNIVVARAVAYNLLLEDEIPEDLLSLLSNSIEYYRNEKDESFK